MPLKQDARKSLDRSGSDRVDEPDTLGALMNAANQGDKVAYNRLLRTLVPLLRRYFAHRILPSEIDDLVQDALVAIDRRRHTYDPSRPFRPWLFAIARYKWIDRLRANKRNLSVPLDDHDMAVDDHGSRVGSRLAITRLLSFLKPAQAKAIALVKVEGFSIEEASSITGQSASLVKVNIHRGMARLSALVALPAAGSGRL